MSATKSSPHPDRACKGSGQVRSGQELWFRIIAITMISRKATHNGEPCTSRTPNKTVEQLINKLSNRHVISLYLDYISSATAFGLGAHRVRVPQPISPAGGPNSRQASYPSWLPLARATPIPVEIPQPSRWSLNKLRVYETPTVVALRVPEPRSPTVRFDLGGLCRCAARS